MAHNSSGRKTSFLRGELGASMIASLDEGVDSYKTANEVLDFAFNEIMGRSQANLDNDKMLAGRMLENAIIDMYLNKNDMKTERVNIDPPVCRYEVTSYVPKKIQGVLKNFGIEKCFVAASRDAFLETNLDNKFSGDHQVPIEVKNLSGSYDQPIKTQHWVQLQTQMLCSKNAPFGILLRLLNGWDLKVDTVDADFDYHERIIFMATDFWTRLGILLDDPSKKSDIAYPFATSAEASRFIVPGEGMEAIDLQDNEQVKELIQLYLQRKEIKKAANQQFEEVEIQLKEILGEYQTGYYKIGEENYEIKHTKFERKKTKSVPIKGEPPTIGRRFSVKLKKET